MSYVSSNVNDSSYLLLNWKSFEAHKTTALLTRLLIVRKILLHLSMHFDIYRVGNNGYITSQT